MSKTGNCRHEGLSQRERSSEETPGQGREVRPWKKETEKPVFIIFLLLGPKCKDQTVLL